MNGAKAKKSVRPAFLVKRSITAYIDERKNETNTIKMVCTPKFRKRAQNSLKSPEPRTISFLRIADIKANKRNIKTDIVNGRIFGLYSPRRSMKMAYLLGISK